jgi:hypothetical protein
LKESCSVPGNLSVRLLQGPFLFAFKLNETLQFDTYTTTSSSIDAKTGNIYDQIKDHMLSEGPIETLLRSQGVGLLLLRLRHSDVLHPSLSAERPEQESGDTVVLQYFPSYDDTNQLHVRRDCLSDERLSTTSCSPESFRTLDGSSEFPFELFDVLINSSLRDASITNCQKQGEEVLERFCSTTLQPIKNLPRLSVDDLHFIDFSDFSDDFDVDAKFLWTSTPFWLSLSILSFMILVRTTSCLGSTFSFDPSGLVAHVQRFRARPIICMTPSSLTTTRFRSTQSTSASTSFMTTTLMPSRPRCQMCGHRPHRRTECETCHRKMCPACYGNVSAPVCQHCTEPEPEPIDMFVCSPSSTRTSLLHEPFSLLSLSQGCGNSDSLTTLSRTSVSLSTSSSSTASTAGITDMAPVSLQFEPRSTLLSSTTTLPSTTTSISASLCTATASTLCTANFPELYVLSSLVRCKKLKKDFWECLFDSSY